MMKPITTKFGVPKVQFQRSHPRYSSSSRETCRRRSRPQKRQPDHARRLSDSEARLNHEQTDRESEMAPTGAMGTSRAPDTLPYIPIRDELETETSEAQDETFDLCLPLLSVESAELELAGQPEGKVYARGLPKLERQRHVAFLKGALGTLPSAFVAVDASRPWLFYWTLMGLQLLGQDVSSYRAR